MVVEPFAPVLDDRYEVGQLIGRGAMGEVHRGWDRRLERPVAIKCLRRDLAADDGVRQRFEEEARAAGGLAHHNIVTVFDTGEHDGVPYIVMECLPGRTLEDELAEGPMAVDDVAAMGAELAGHSPRPTPPACCTAT
jgi:serine/threonine protein kinase